MLCHLLHGVTQDMDVLRSGKNACCERLSTICCCLQGGTLTEQRRHSAAETAKRSGVFGYALCGFGTGETAEQRRECIEAAVSELPVQSPRLVQGAFAPDALLEAVSLGVDMFDGTYASQVSGTEERLL